MRRMAAFMFPEESSLWYSTQFAYIFTITFKGTNSTHAQTRVPVRTLVAHVYTSLRETKVTRATFLAFLP